MEDNSHPTPPCRMIKDENYVLLKHIVKILTLDKVCAPLTSFFSLCEINTLWSNNGTWVCEFSYCTTLTVFWLSPYWKYDCPQHCFFTVLQCFATVIHCNPGGMPTICQALCVCKTSQVCCQSTLWALFSQNMCRWVYHTSDVPGDQECHVGLQYEAY